MVSSSAWPWVACELDAYTELNPSGAMLVVLAVVEAVDAEVDAAVAVETEVDADVELPVATDVVAEVELLLEAPETIDAATSSERVTIMNRASCSCHCMLLLFSFARKGY